MNCQFMFCFHVKTRDIEREGRFSMEVGNFLGDLTCSVCQLREKPPVVDRVNLRVKSGKVGLGSGSEKTEKVHLAAVLYNAAAFLRL